MELMYFWLISQKQVGTSYLTVVSIQSQTLLMVSITLSTFITITYTPMPTKRAEKEEAKKVQLMVNSCQLDNSHQRTNGFEQRQDDHRSSNKGENNCSIEIISIAILEHMFYIGS